MPKLDGHYVILTPRSPVSYEVANLDSPDTIIETCHVSTLKPFTDVEPIIIALLRKRRRRKKSVSNTSRNLEAGGEDVKLRFPSMRFRMEIFLISV
ncbi:hypothetical protein CDAR_219531 [Caerostris darwini]|uniref:Uncharacterized protein n=1 Tax=Caerostris darwini TaxID=1538125 RepID=A0AAV4TDM7_9ARAC|nr:hypothetical protein CDAR_219531 [Caerostris darwini]